MMMVSCCSPCQKHAINISHWTTGNSQRWLLCTKLRGNCGVLEASSLSRYYGLPGTAYWISAIDACCARGSAYCYSASNARPLRSFIPDPKPTFDQNYEDERATRRAAAWPIHSYISSTGYSSFCFSLYNVQRVLQRRSHKTSTPRN